MRTVRTMWMVCVMVLSCMAVRGVSAVRLSDQEVELWEFMTEHGFYKKAMGELSDQERRDLKKFRFSTHADLTLDDVLERVAALREGEYEPRFYSIDTDERLGEAAIEARNSAIIAIRLRMKLAQIGARDHQNLMDLKGFTLKLTGDTWVKMTMMYHCGMDVEVTSKLTARLQAFRSVPVNVKELLYDRERIKKNKDTIVRALAIWARQAAKLYFESPTVDPGKEKVSTEEELAVEFFDDKIENIRSFYSLSNEDFGGWSLTSLQAAGDA